MILKETGFRQLSDRGLRVQLRPDLGHRGPDQTELSWHYPHGLGYDSASYIFPGLAVRLGLENAQ
jgi:hypothetical protein